MCEFEFYTNVRMCTFFIMKKKILFFSIYTGVYMFSSSFVHVFLRFSCLTEVLEYFFFQLNRFFLNNCIFLHRATAYCDNLLMNHDKFSACADISTPAKRKQKKQRNK